jgi:phosphohistidine phosphatase
MKELFLIRHAKSDWEKMDIKDIDRPLKGRGVRDALVMGKFLGEHYSRPDLILTSPACRAFHTAVLFCRAMDASCEVIRVRQNLYLASYNEMLATIREAPGDKDVLALVTHNPGVTDMANFFLEESIHNIPTSGFVYMAFDCDSWEEVKSDTMVKHAFHYPKELLTE